MWLMNGRRREQAFPRERLALEILQHPFALLRIQLMRKAQGVITGKLRRRTAFAFILRPLLYVPRGPDVLRPGRRTK